MKNLLKYSAFIFVILNTYLVQAAPPKKANEARPVEAQPAAAPEAPKVEDKKDELSPVGIWWTKNQEAKVELYMKDSTLEGKIIWLKEPEENGKPKVDTHNPDKNLQSRPILNMVFLTGFKKASVEKNKWIDGTIYDAKSGKTYNAWIKVLNEKNMQLRGYVGISLFGRTEEWTKVTP